ncbi:MAG: hypothetical protein LN589_04750 [Rickettsia endosymbiont of Eriopis connexa]|nr:hypothetical protein [Rickettsia endosymbiont of Eriopis connexa]
MNDILSIMFLIPYLAIYSIIPSIFILNQSTKYRNVKKALPSVITVWVCYSFFIYHFYNIYMTMAFVPYLYMLTVLPAMFFLIYMGYNLWTQSYFNLTIEPQFSIWKQILVSMAIIGYNIRKLSKNAVILKIINKIGAIIIWSMILLYAMMMARIIG